MDFVTGLPPAGDLSYTSALVVVCRFSKKTKFIPVHKDIDAKGVALVCGGDTCWAKLAYH